VLFQELPKAQDGGFIGDTADGGIQAGEIAVQRDIMQALFHRWVRTSDESLKLADAHHQRRRKARAAVLALGCERGIVGKKLGPGNNSVYLRQIPTLAGEFGGRLESRGGEAELFHVDIAFLMRDSMMAFCRYSLKEI